MKNYEKSSLLKFTAIYFFSTSIFIIILGYLYFQQERHHVLQRYTMKMYEYNSKLKQSFFRYKQQGYTYKVTNDNICKYNLAQKTDNIYRKSFPFLKGKQFLTVIVDAKIIDAELYTIKRFTIILQISLILFFLFISFILAKISLKPMNDTISHLDRFIKDLIHDLNTPATSILLNIKMLKKELKEPKNLKKINRIENSTQAIAALYDNLEVLIQQQLEKEKINLLSILEEQKENCLLNFPHIKFHIQQKDYIVNTNKKAIIRILNNILTNSCKYSNENPAIDITMKESTLTISDNGKGIRYPEKIFERSYSESDNGHGIGMHIVQRLCKELNIKISIKSREKIGTVISLKFQV